MQFGLVSLKQCLEIEATIFHPTTILYTVAYVVFLGYKYCYSFQDWWDGISLELPCFRYSSLFQIFCTGLQTIVYPPVMEQKFHNLFLKRV